MNLICPHCQKTVSIPDSVGGQTTKCPECGGPFTAPRVDIPPTPPPKQSPPPPSAPPPVSDLPPGPPPVLGDYSRRVALPLSAGIVKWITPACFLVMFILTFFPWAGIYMGSKMVVRQSAWGIAFGGYTEYREKKVLDNTDAKRLLLIEDKLEKPSWGPLTLLYLLLVLLGMLAAIALVVLPFAAPPLAEKVGPWGSLGMGGLSLLALGFLALQVVIGFPLQRAYDKELEEGYDKEVKEAKDISDSTAKEEALEGLEFFNELGKKMWQRTVWLRLVIALNIVAVLASLLTFWLERRVGLPPPRLQVEF